MVWIPQEFTVFSPISYFFEQIDMEIILACIKAIQNTAFHNNFFLHVPHEMVD